MLREPMRGRHTGKFTVSEGRAVFGELTYAGPRTSLYLRDDAYFETRHFHGGCLKGILHDLSRVSLLHCQTTDVPGNVTSLGESYYYAEVFPHFVVQGDRQITNDEKVITEVQFLVDDASSLFYDVDAFGSLIDAESLIGEVARAKRHEREEWPIHDRDIPVGEDPVILYFGGRHEIISVETMLGKVYARHHTSRSLGGPEGVSIESKTFTGITFNDPCSFDDTINRTSMVLRFLEIVAGRPQNVLSLQVHVKADTDVPCMLDVYWTMPPKRSGASDMRPDPVDALVDGVAQPEEFANVLTNWLSRDEAWREARLRFGECFAAQHYYGVDRIVGAANMFDILPDSAAPPTVPLSEEVKSAKDKCKNICNELPASPERESLLNALGRLGKSALKNKIQYRAKVLTNALGSQFPDLTVVTNEAVNCRNFYVHGGKPRFDYGNNFDVRIFLTDTLEFLFAATDLVEAGWDIKRWNTSLRTMSHPFGRYRANYLENLCKLKGLLPQGPANSNG